MEIPYAHVDAFASRVFSGNPAGVCLLERWLDDATLQGIAAENKHSETAFLVETGGAWELRWFTPEAEVDLCGHATLAAAHVLHSRRALADPLRFSTRSGVLSVAREGDLLVLDFPSRPPGPCEGLASVATALGGRPAEVLKSRDFLAVYETEEEVRALEPDMAAVAGLEALGVIATAPGRSCDFVSRFFAPGVGVPEDPVTGSAHCTLVPYWSRRLGRRALRALQVSRRGGELFCRDEGERVSIAGRAVTYLEGVIRL